MAQRRMTKATEITKSSANPHSPGQRGLLEYTNGVLRQDRPKRSDLSGFTQEAREAMTWRLNTRPRMSLGF
jgi:IS30 family transposase